MKVKNEKRLKISKKLNIFQFLQVKLIERK